MRKAKETMLRGAAGALRGTQDATEPSNLPEWNLADLYPSMESPEVRRDLKAAAEQAVAFEARWKGSLAGHASRPSEGGLGEAMRAYEALEELIGRIVSYAGLVYAGDTSDPARAKFYGDVQER